jgi:hypothetical protein
MPQSLANLLVHIVFSTRDRRPFLQDADIRDRMHRYLVGISGTFGIDPAAAPNCATLSGLGAMRAR